MSVERYIEVTDTKKKSSQKYKIFLTILCLALIWLAALVIALPMIFSFESNQADELGSISCQTNWTDKQINAFFIFKFIFIFMIPFGIILVGSVKLLIFLIEWQKKFAKSAFCNSTRPRVKLETG